MSILTPPVIGFPDDQQQAQWSSGVVLNQTDVILAAGSKVYATVNASQWQSSQIACTAGAGDIALQMAWYADSGATQFLASKRFVIAKLLRASVIVPNMGPFLVITAFAGTSNTSSTILVNETNRTAIPWNPDSLFPLLDINNVSVAATSVVTTDALYPYSGPATLYVEASNAANWAVVVQGLDTAGNVHRVWAANQGDGTGITRKNPIVVPALHIQAVITNNDASARNFYAVLVPDLFH